MNTEKIAEITETETQRTEKNALAERVQSYIRRGWVTLFLDTASAGMLFLVALFLRVPGIALACFLLWGMIVLSHCRTGLFPMGVCLCDRLTGCVETAEAELYWQKDSFHFSELTPNPLTAGEKKLRVTFFVRYGEKRVPLHTVWREGIRLDAGGVAAMMHRRGISSLRVRVAYTRYAHILLSCEPVYLPSCLHSTEIERAQSFFASL